ncbi:hypothetical protein BVI1335_600074 [Burkholderia vietnamiensis]|nr:hypothetical protein BVI1335_600074 [Burkholderia vietnamiensis]
MACPARPQARLARRFTAALFSPWTDADYPIEFPGMRCCARRLSGRRRQCVPFARHGHDFFVTGRE